MKQLWTRLFWGLLLVAAGGLLLANSLGYISLSFTHANGWGYALAALSGLFLITYFINGVTHWGWLFPAFILGGSAATLFLQDADYNASWIVAPVLAGVGLPFIVAFFTKPRSHWWALIPAWVMAVLAVAISFGDRLPAEYIAGGILASIGLPFLVVFLLRPSRWWALFPSMVMILMGAAIAFGTQVSGELGASLAVFAVALPFFVIFLTSSKRWWALIPAGVLTSVAVLPFAASLKGINESLAVGIFFSGLTLTFLILWLMRSKAPTAWAVIPAILMGIIAALGFAFGAQTQFVGPILLIVAGVVVLSLAFRTKKAPPVVEEPKKKK